MQLHPDALWNVLFLNSDDLIIPWLDALSGIEKGTGISSDFFFSNPSAEVVLYKPLKLSFYPLNYGNAKKQAR